MRISLHFEKENGYATLKIYSSSDFFPESSCISQQFMIQCKTRAGGDVIAVTEFITERKRRLWIRN